MYKTRVGTPIIMAPEILERISNYDNKCDLRSIGIILYYLTFNEFPYNIATEAALLNNIKIMDKNFLKKVLIKI